MNKPSDFSVEKIESHFEEIYATYMKRSGAGKAVIAGRFCENPVPMSEIAAKLHLTKQGIDQLEKRIVKAAKLGIEEEISDFVSFVDFFFDIRDYFINDKTVFMLGKVLSGHYGCYQLSGTVFAKTKTDPKKILYTIAGIIRTEGLPLRLNQVSIDGAKPTGGWELLFSIPEINEKFRCHDNTIFYYRASSRSSTISNLGHYIQSGFGERHGIEGVYATLKEHASDILEADGIYDIEDFVALASKRSCNLPAGSIMAIGKSKWEISSYFIRIIGGQKKVNDIVDECLKIADELPCDTTSVYLLDRLNERFFMHEQINYYSLKNLLVLSGKFRNIKKFNIIPVDKECEKNAFGLRDSIVEILKNGPLSNKMISEELEKRGLSYTGVTVGMALMDKHIFGYADGKYFLISPSTA